MLQSADIEDGRQDSDRTSNTGNSAPHPKDIKWMNRHTARVSAELIEVVPADTASVGRKKHNKLKPEIIDRIASFVFVILFLAFNIFYWTYFVTSHDG